MQAGQPIFGRWSMPLHQPPRVERMGVGVHGLSPTERFHVTGLWSLHLYRYTGELHVISTGDTFPICPGYAGITPPDMDIEYRFQEHSVHLWAHLAIAPHQPSMLNANIGLPHSRTPGQLPCDATAREVPAMADLDDAFPSWWALGSRILGRWPRQQPASAFAWHLLWTLVDLVHQPQAAANDSTSIHLRHSAVGQALKIIETRLNEPLRVSDIANEVALSHNQFIRVFRAATGLTPLAYIRTRRIDQAVHLLTKSTRPIKSIAAEVGIPDLQAFNKAIRTATGRPPRAHRR